MVEEKTVVEKTLQVRQQVTMKMMNALMPKNDPKQAVSYSPAEIAGAIFCGHIVTDCDSIAGAIGAAYLFGGTPAAASQLNAETLFALEYWKVPAPATIE